MREVPVSAAGAVDRAIVGQLEARLRTMSTLGNVLAWSRRLSPPRSVAEIVTQDEYTHDVIMAFDDRHYLVFDTT